MVLKSNLNLNLKASKMNMKELVSKLLSNGIIEVLTKDMAENNMLEWFNEKFEQYIMASYDKMIVYTNDDGFITDIFGFSFNGEKWFALTFDDDYIEIDDYSVCDLSLWNKQELALL
jgi:hypothetical protein